MTCYFSCLTDPLIYTFLLSSVYALICQLGYSRSAELIYSSFLAVFGRNDYKKFMNSWRELKAAKAEVGKVSAQVKKIEGIMLFITCSPFRSSRMNSLNGPNCNVELINFKLISISNVKIFITSDFLFYWSF